MITAEQRTRIRRLYYAEHWKVGTIAEELGLHHTTVSSAIGAENFISRGKSVRPSRLDPYKPLLLETLEKHPRLRATRLYEMAHARGYEGSPVQVRRWVKTVRPERHQEAFLQLQTLPGEQGQVDWGSFGRIKIGRATRSLSCFVLVLSWSRGMYARFFLDQKMDSFLRGHVGAFHTLGGVPRELLYDNLKSVVLDRVGDHVQYHPRILELAGHYHFAPKPCAPYRGNEKGKVERTIQYLRHSFFEARRFESIEDLNHQLAEWIERVAHERPVPGDPDKRRVREALEIERERLLSLPEHPFDCAHVQPVRSSKRPYVRFDLNDYSIPHTLVRKPLTLLAAENEVRITDPAGQLVARHARSYDRGQIIEAPEHLAALVQEKKKARELRGRDRLTASCPSVQQLLEGLAQRGEPLRPQTARLNRLLDRYGAEQLQAAIAVALERGAIHASSIEHILEGRARAKRQPPAVELVLPDDPRVRDVRTQSQRLSDYDRLGASLETDDEDAE